MTKKVMLLVIALLMVFAMAACGNKDTGTQQKNQEQTGSSQPEAKTITLKLATNHPLTHVATVAGSQYFIQEVEKRTNGKVKFEFYPAEQLGKAKDMLKIVKSQTADMVYVWSGLISGEIPLTTVGELPGLFSDPVVAAKAFHKMSKEYFYDKELKALGVRPIADIEWSQTTVFSKKPINSLADLKGLKIATSGDAQTQAVNALGGVPVLMPITEAYEGIQRGVVDGTLAMFNNAESYKINEVTKYAVDGAGLGGYAGYYLINESSWQKLPEDVKQVMLEVGAEISENIAKTSAGNDVKVMKKWEEAGMKIYHLSDEEKQQWNQKLEPVHEKWASSLEAKGLPGREILNSFKQYLKDAEQAQ